MSSVEQEIERRIARAMADWQRTVTTQGAPLEIDEAWLQTPEGLRMPFRVLKNAGVPPQEIELFHERATLRERIQQATDAAERQRLQQRLSELEQSLAFRLERLKRMGQG